MHAVVVNVSIGDPEGSEKTLKEQVVPRVAQAPGFVTGYWTRKDTTGVSMVVFDSEEQAQAMAEQVPGLIPETVTLQNVEVREVVANA